MSLNDNTNAWRLARKLSNMSSKDIKNIFGSTILQGKKLLNAFL